MGGLRSARGACQMVKAAIRRMLEQRFRLSIGQQFLAYINFVLLVITASRELKPVLGIERTSVLVGIAVPVAFFFLWAIGYAMDRYFKMPEIDEGEYIKRSPAWQEVLGTLRALERR